MSKHEFHFFSINLAVYFHPSVFHLFCEIFRDLPNLYFSGRDDKSCNSSLFW